MEINQDKQKFINNQETMQRQPTYNQQQSATNQMGHKLCPSVRNTELNLELLQEQYHKYKSEPYLYILQRMQQLRKNEWSVQMQSQYRLLLMKISQFYNQVPYHNITHGFDVMIAVDKFLIQYKMKEQLSITDEERIHILIAAYAHDNGHQGLTNSFYINSQDQLALRYSNISPLENMHSSNLLTSLRQFNISVSLKMKQLMVKLILATDNKHHFELLEKIKNYQAHVNAKIVDKDTDNLQKEEKSQTDKLSQSYRQTLLEMVIHTADLSPCGKTTPEYLKWNQKLYDEFKFEYKLQRELKLKTYSFKFDLSNEKHSFAVENLSFLNGMILPFFKEVAIVMPRFEKELYNAIRIRDYFQKKVKEIDEKKKNAVKQKIEN